MEIRRGPSKTLRMQSLMVYIYPRNPVIFKVKARESFKSWQKGEPGVGRLASEVRDLS